MKTINFNLSQKRKLEVQSKKLPIIGISGGDSEKGSILYYDIYENIMNLENEVIIYQGFIFFGCIFIPVRGYWEKTKHHKLITDCK